MVCKVDFTLQLNFLLDGDDADDPLEDGSDDDLDAEHLYDEEADERVEVEGVPYDDNADGIESNSTPSMSHYLNHTSATSGRDGHLRSEVTHILIPRTCGICLVVSKISSWKGVKLALEKQLN